MEQIELNLSGCATREELHSRIRDALDSGTFAQFRAEYSERLDRKI